MGLEQSCGLSVNGDRVGLENVFQIGGLQVLSEEPRTKIGEVRASCTKVILDLAMGREGVGPRSGHRAEDNVIDALGACDADERLRLLRLEERLRPARRRSLSAAQGASVMRSTLSGV